MTVARGLLYSSSTDECPVVDKTAEQSDDRFVFLLEVEASLRHREHHCFVYQLSEQNSIPKLKYKKKMIISIKNDKMITLVQVRELLNEQGQLSCEK